MAFEAVDACYGTPHISSEDLAALNEAAIGESDCVMQWGDNFKATMSSANACLIGTGVGMVGGKRFWNKAAVSLTVQSGTQGQKRNDLVVARYAKTSAGVESIVPVVIKGTATTGTPADPDVTANDLKLWRIPLDGITVGTPVALFDPLPSLAELGESVSPMSEKLGRMEFSNLANGFDLGVWDNGFQLVMKTTAGGEVTLMADDTYGISFWVNGERKWTK